MRASTAVAILSLTAWVALSVALPLPAFKFEERAPYGRKNRPDPNQPLYTFDPRPHSAPSVPPSQPPAPPSQPPAPPLRLPPWQQPQPSAHRAGPLSTTFVHYNSDGPHGPGVIQVPPPARVNQYDPRPHPAPPGPSSQPPGPSSQPPGPSSQPPGPSSQPPGRSSRRPARENSHPRVNPYPVIRHGAPSRQPQDPALYQPPDPSLYQAEVFMLPLDYTGPPQSQLTLQHPQPLRPPGSLSYNQPTPQHSQPLRPPGTLSYNLNQPPPPTRRLFVESPSIVERELLEHIDQRIKLAARAYVRELLMAPMDDLD